MSSTSAAMRLNLNLQLIPPRWLYFCVFTVSGFSGLIYESIWSHYLKLFLGHAAYAQSLVLMIFMGGMAAGSWIASRYSTQWKTPLLAYAIVEVVIGVLALVFHNVFQSVIDTFYASILPGLDSPALGSILKWSAAALLIVPQSILLGMTFPLMSAGILRRYPSTPGGSLAMLYFTNSIGAAVGVLVSGFWLIGLAGLPGTIFTAGMLNICLALTVWILVRLDPMAGGQAIEPAEIETEEHRSVSMLFLIAAFITGAASFIYEIGWIRMLSLVLGGTTHSFELMLSAFITGLAFGGLWIKRRIDRIDNPVLFSGGVQILMGTAAILTLPLYSLTFDWMQDLMGALNKNDAGFALFSLGSHAIALAVMLPATFLAGMTLPLFTYVLMKKGSGERAIGRVYAANTFGAIVGVLFAIHIGLPLLGMKTLISFGAALDVVLGIVLIAYATANRWSYRIAGGALIGLGAIVVIQAGYDLDHKRMISGVYRHGNPNHLADAKILFYKDGKTATVGLSAQSDGTVAITTNAKPDASLYLDGARFSTDEITMIMAGSLPLAYKPDAKIIGNIGFGSGLTTHTLLADASIERVDTIEIEAMMPVAAQGFGARVRRAFRDSRSRIHIEDAKTYFSLNNQRYDIIIAEPSNPWVSGVASLFTEEFYRSVNNFLVNDGLFVQWIQLYEFDDELMMSILKALAPQFSDYVVYTTGGSDLLVIARANGSLGEPDLDRILNSNLAAEGRRVKLITRDDFLARKLAGKAIIESMFPEYRVPPNSDYYPYLDLNAGKARFKSAKSTLLIDWSLAPLPVLEMLHGDGIDFGNTSRDGYFERMDAVAAAETIHNSLVNRSAGYARKSMPIELYIKTRNVQQLFVQCSSSVDEIHRRLVRHDVAVATLAFLNRTQATELVEAMSDTECWSDISLTERRWIDHYLAIAQRDAEGMAETGLLLLGDPEAIALPATRNYALTSTMLGLVRTGRHAEAVRIWREHGLTPDAQGGIPGYTTLLLRLAHAGI